MERRGWTVQVMSSRSSSTVVEAHADRAPQPAPSLPPAAVFRAFSGLGGERGWLYLNWTWQMRGWFDKLIGGVGLRRGRRHPDRAPGG